MVERSPRDSSRDLLEELEDGWGTPRPPPAEPFAKSASAAPADRGSNPNLDELDEGWLDDLFPGEEEPDEEEDEEPEPELPDERIDPVAYAAAKAARDERAAKKKEKRRAKAESKRARQKARAAAMRQKQKSKKARASAPRREEPKKRAPATPSSDRAMADESDDLETAAAVVAKQKTSPTHSAPSTMGSIKLLAIVLVVLLAVAAAVAAIIK